MIAKDKEQYKRTKAFLEDMQNFDASSLARKEELGEAYHFEEAVEPVRNLIDLYKRLSVTALEYFSDEILEQIEQQAQQDNNSLKRILDFDASTDSTEQRNHLIDKVRKAYDTALKNLNPYIADSLHRSAGYQKLESEARATMQSIEDELADLTNKLREFSAEKGVSQQAIYFKKESEHHDKKAGWWLFGVLIFAITLVLYTIGGLFLHKIPDLEPKTIYDAIQLTISKILIFSTVAYLLFLSARNFLNHKHNAIINKHRLNALLTYQALVEASGDAGVRDAVLLQASSCIFSPQSTGYAAGHETDISRQKSLVEILSKSATNTAQDVGK